jgi:predicted glycoside hydrolase/deacetylase ChbG (UPF0249 family)
LKYLIVNADDFGLTETVSRGILEALNEGVVASTSVMVCTPRGADLLAQYADELRGRAGIHLQLTGGVPCSSPQWIPSLLNGHGRLPQGRTELQQPRADEIEIEWHAQLERFCECGLDPTHINTHHHVHKDSEAFAAYCRIAAECQVPARSCGPGMTRRLSAAGVSCADAFVDSWTGKSCTPDDLIWRVEAALESAGEAETVELMCHPGFYDPELEGQSSMVESRLRELSALCDPQLSSRLSARGIALANWSVVETRSVYDISHPRARKKAHGGAHL